MDKYKKFIPFAKVDVAKREVWGIVTAEVPDKEDEVCDYDKSLPYYKNWMTEISKATDGKSIGNLREMHQLTAVGKGIGYEFRENEKEIFMGFKVVDDDAWKKVDEGVYTGFSQGGRKVGDMVPDPVYKGCMRYVADPSEVSLVDNPCLASAHFAYIKTDGSMELRKFKKTEVPVSAARLAAVEQEVALLKASGVTVAKAGKTKKKGGKELHSSDFAYVGNPDDTATWKLPIHDKAHARNALARFNQTQGIPASKKAAVHARIVAACKKFGVDVASENEKLATTMTAMRKAVRVYVNKRADKIVSKRLLDLDINLGVLLNKGMWEVSRMAELLQNIVCLFHCVASEQEFEHDLESEQPTMLADNIGELIETLLEMVDEETRELGLEIAAREHAA